MASSDTSGKRTCGNIHNGISILLEVQSSSFQTICPFPLRVLPFASGSRSTRVLLSESKPGQTSLSLSLFLFFSFPTFLHPILFFLPLYCRGIGNSSARRKNERKIRRSFPCPTTLLSPLSAQFSSPLRETSIFHPGLFLIFLSPSNVHLRERSFAPRRNYSLDLETLKRLLFREGCPIDRERSVGEVA